MLTHGSPGLADDRRGAFSIVLVGNQIADYLWVLMFAAAARTTRRSAIYVPVLVTSWDLYSAAACLWPASLTAYFPR
jgi:hypothetical protein